MIIFGILELPKSKKVGREENPWHDLNFIIGIPVKRGGYPGFDSVEQILRDFFGRCQEVGSPPFVTAAAVDKWNM